MRDLVLPFPPRQKVPVYNTITLQSGSFSTMGQATFTLKDNAGNSVASGNVTGNATVGLALSEWVSVDGSALSFTSGVYVLEFSEPVTPSDATARTETPSVILYVPGVPAARSLYPTGDDLQVFLVGAGMLSNPPTSAQSLIDLDSAVASAVSEFETMTGFIPFLYGGTVTTRTFRSEGNIVSFAGGGLVALDSGADAIASGAANFTVDSNAQLMPLNAAARSKPYTYLKFISPNTLIYSPYVYTLSDGVPARGHVGGRTITVSVRGKWGYGLTVREDVWKAILYLAALQVIPSLEILLTGGLAALKLGNDEFTFLQRGGSVFSGSGTQWQSHIDKTVAIIRADRGMR
jgi:hypothetical protein